MTIEETEDVAVSETTESTPQDDTKDQRMVPLAALQAERRKRQDIEAKAYVYQQQLLQKQSKEEDEPEEDPHALVEKGAFKQATQITKREILEEVFLDANPMALQEIDNFLKPILEKKPWLAESVDRATNRYARAYEIIQDYRHLVVQPSGRTTPQQQDAKRIVDNANKPRSPIEIGKSVQPKGSEYLKSIQGTKEFREYRQKVRQGN